ncbi:MAG: tRNA dihydrouridine synthase DusB [Candidatus Zipacnadales bacterium]
MLIHNVLVDPELVLAPMAGINSLPFRLLCRKAGAGLVYSEMVSANAIHYGSTKTRSLLVNCPQEKPLAIQIFGSDPERIATAAQHVEAAGADIVDINMGCPVRKVRKSGAGCELMRDPERAVACARAAVKAVQVPVTVKLRIGWSYGDTAYLDLSSRLANVGVAAITLHARPAAHSYHEPADWDAIARLVEVVPIPVIGNGDVFTAEDALRMQRHTGCAAVMMGRAALGNPLIFREASNLLRGQSRTLSPRWRLAAALWHAQANVLHYGETIGIRRIRAQVCWYSRGLPGAARFRREACAASTLSQLAEAILALLDRLPSELPPTVRLSIYQEEAD